MRRKPGLKPGFAGVVTYAGRCPHCGKRYVHLSQHVNKCTQRKQGVSK